MKRLAPLTIEERVEGPDRLVLLRGSADILCLPAIQDLFGRYSKEKIRLRSEEHRLNSSHEFVSRMPSSA